MTLAAGTRIGVYEILAPLGAGGMGEVYRARDARLGRDVAIKILPAAFTNDAERLERFEREARVLASLSHQNIAAIYGLEEREGLRALVLELVEGDTLAEVIRARGALPADEALAVARQIAEALDTAHEKGIVHRDLKPANIKINPAGVVKVLDFGLARAVAVAGTPQERSAASTLARTLEGVVLGTAAYMSPEQARGLAVDKRADVWAFGCVLYEMLTGRPPFGGATLTDTLAAILSAEPDWTALPGATPPGVVRVLRRCLDRDVKRRLRDLGDLDVALDATVESGPRPMRRSWTAWALVATTSALVTAGVMLALSKLMETPPDRPLTAHLEIPIPVTIGEVRVFAVSPDGRRLVFVGTGPDGIMRLWLRALDTLETRPISGTEAEVANNSSIFWSPDSRFIGFYADGKVKKVAVDGGPVGLICEVPGVAIGGGWHASGVVVVGSSGSGILRCPANGGTATPVTKSPDTRVLHLFPSWLPDGQHFLYLRVNRSNPSENGVYIADLNRAAETQSADPILQTGFHAAFVPSAPGSGRVLFVREKTLWAVPFDTGRLAVSGAPVEIAAPVGSFRDAAFFSASPNVLVVRGEVPDRQLTWRDRKGSDLGAVGEPGPFTGLALSPDAMRAVVIRENRLSRSDQDLWLVDLSRATTTRFTSDAFPESVPTWSADGTTLIFAVGHGSGDITAKSITGTPGQSLLDATSAPGFVNPLLTTMDATADGRFVVFTIEARTGTGSDLWLLPLSGNGKPAPLLQQEFDQIHGAISPDGRWLAYASNESGVNEVFARSLSPDATTGLPKPGAAMVVSKGGGMAPRWRGDSQELFYQSSAGGVMAVRVSAGKIETPIELFKAQGMLPHWGVSRDGQRFLLALPVQVTQAPFGVTLNWTAAR